MTTRVEPSVLWREGMFLFPQHLQAFSRELAAQIQAAGSIGVVGNWGLLELAVDDDALQEDAFSVERATIVLRDGALASFPLNGVIKKREFAEHFSGPELDVYLGVPTAQSGVPQIGSDDERLHRYRVLRDEVLDENDREGRREMEFRQYQGQLFFGEEDRSGFDSVPIARLARAGKPKTRSVLSTTYIPPVLRCGASPVLSNGLTAVAERARAQSRDLASRMPDLARLSSVERGSDVQGLFKLQAVNQCVGLLEQAAALDALHPFQVYQTLTGAIGALSVFGAGRVVPELPAYDHGDLDGCFRTVFDAVNSLLVAEEAAPYDQAPFKPDDVRPGLYSSDLPAEWVDRQGIFHLAVEIAEEPDTVREMVAAGVKLLAEQDIERVLQGVMPGIELRHERVPPLSFPKRDTLHYFAIETEGESRDQWLRILQSRSAQVLSAMGSPDDVSFHFYVEFPD